MNLADRVSGRVLDMVGRISTGISRMGNDEPFGARKVSLERQVESYRMMTPDRMFQMIGKHGKLAVERYISHMEGLMEKRRNG